MTTPDFQAPDLQTPDFQTQASTLLSQIAGYVGVRTMAIGVRSGLLAALAERPDGATADELARSTGLDPFYVRVFCRAAFASHLLELRSATDDEGYDPVSRSFKGGDAQRYVVAPHVATLLLDGDHPGYIGGVPLVMTESEIFDLFEEKLPTGERIWWNDCSPGFIESVSGTGRPFYNRLIPAGLSKVPGVAAALESGAAIAELCCGSGRGLQKLAAAYPACRITGVDGDGYSLEVAADNLAKAGVADRVALVQSSLEELDLADQDLVLINISMHECRDIDAVTRNVRRALRPGGTFVISDFPFPEATAQCRTVPARIMSGIQYFEALIDDQLMPTSAFVDVLERHGFAGIGSFDLNGVHAVTYGTVGV